MDNQTTQSNIDNDQLDIIKHQATLGNSIISLKNLLKSKLFHYDPGFLATAACKSNITFIDGEQGKLLYRGYPIEELAKNKTYIEVCFLLLYGNLPSANEATELEQKLCKMSDLSDTVWQLILNLNPKNHPVGNLLTIIGACAAENYSTQTLKTSESRLATMLKTIGIMPTIVAACQRICAGLTPIKPNPKMGYVENFLYMSFADTPDPVLVNALDTILTLHADHEQNASTSTVRMAGSTKAPGMAAISAGIAALWGPAHGGANEACINMLKTIGSVDNANLYINKAKDKDDTFRLMGFGHRVYKNYDPRATIMRDICNQVTELLSTQDIEYFELAKKLESIALQDEYFIKRKLYPNIDFYSGITLDAIGFNTQVFTTIFALGRTVGWASHWLEMFTDPEFKISRPRQWYCGPKQRTVE